MFMFPSIVAVLGFAALTRAIDHPVIVGGPDGVPAFHPASVTASVGDTVTFTFQQKNHTITQSSLTQPCTPLAGGFDSGFQPVAPGNTTGPFPAATLKIGNTSPIWLYCRQKNPSPHCAAGMVFAVNPADDAQLAAFQAAAKATAGNSTTNSSSTANGTSASASATDTASSASASATPTNHKVSVGDSGQLSYNPTHINAQVGDTITFEFRAKNHTISQSSFAAPCRLLGVTSGTQGFDSGFMPVAAGEINFPTYTITVNDTQPIWAYCRQTNPASHCGSGMVFAVNALETGDKSFDAFAALAKQLNGTSSSGSTSPKQNSAHAFAGQSVLTLVAVALGVVAVL